MATSDHFLLNRLEWQMLSSNYNIAAYFLGYPPVPKSRTLSSSLFAKCSKNQMNIPIPHFVVL